MSNIELTKEEREHGQSIWNDAPPLVTPNDAFWKGYESGISIERKRQGERVCEWIEGPEPYYGHSSCSPDIRRFKPNRFWKLCPDCGARIIIKES